MQEGQDGDLLVVRGGLSVRESRDLEERCVLHADGERGLARKRARDLDDQKSHRGRVPET